MATRRRRAPAETEPELANIPQLTEPLPPMTATDERRAAELEDIIDEIGSESRVRIWQVTDGKSSFAGEMSGDGFTLDALLDAYGGGDKALAIYTGRTCVSRVKVSLDPTIPPKNPRIPKAIPGTVAPNPVTDMSTIMAGVMANQLQSAQAMTTMMTGIIGALTSVMSATKPSKDPTEIALEIAKVMRGGDNNSGSPSDFLAALKQGIDIGERIGGGKGEDDGVMSSVNKGLDVLGDIVRGVVEDRRRAPALALPAPAAPPVSAPPGMTEDELRRADPKADESPLPTPTETETVGTIRPWVAAARPYIGQLFAAHKFMQPDAAAATIAHNLNDDQFFDLLDDIQDPAGGGFGVRLREYFPKEVAGTDLNWIGQVVHVLLTEYVDDGGEETIEDGKVPPTAPTSPAPDGPAP